jgi:glycosyltransferase involved in cell wall biosynthesis
MMLSVVVPVYNRPEEIRELLDSLCRQSFKKFEVVIVEDGSAIKSDTVVADFQSKLNIHYFYKKNTGPGDSRNFGMTRASGDYFIILDSDCVLPSHYLEEIHEVLSRQYTDFFGGPDTADEQFTDLQKAINYAMTSFFTTGGIRNSEDGSRKFQPRSFNMGISKKAFEATSGFGNIHPGEDPDLTLRLWKAGFESQLIKNAFVYHKRRISWPKFYKQVYKFGVARPILDRWHPEKKSFVYWFPSLYLLGVATSAVLLLLGNLFLLGLMGIYNLMLFVDAMFKTHSVKIAFQSVIAVNIQFFGYGYGFLKSFFYIHLLKRKPEVQFPDFFFKK